MITRKLKFLLLTLIIFSFYFFISADQNKIAPNAVLNNFTAHLDKSVPALMDTYDVPGTSIAIIRNGKIVWKNAYGYADLKQKRKMSVDAVFRVESISKSVTAWGIMKLVEKGIIDLDAPVQKYLTNWTHLESDLHSSKITVRRLLSHNAGLSLGTIGDEFPPKSNIPSLRDYLANKVRLEREPGSEFSYSNTGYNLLELTIEEVTNQKFSEYMKNEILLPLGMSSSGFEWNDSLQSLLPTGYDLQGDAVDPYVYPTKASGGLFSTVGDVARFVSAGVIGNSIEMNSALKRESLLEIYYPRVIIPGVFGIVSDAYGYGHFIENLPDGRRAVWHGGQGHGWMSHFHFIPASGEGIVILTNSQRSWPVIGQILTDWSAWNGLGFVKMGRINYGIIAMRILISVLILISIYYWILIIYELMRGKRSISPFSNKDLRVRALKVFTGIGIISALIWSSAQPYLIVLSIFPRLSAFAGYSLCAFAITIICSSLFPRVVGKNYLR